MRPLLSRSALPAAVALTLAACGAVARLPVSAGTGPSPELPSPSSGLFPTLWLAPAKGWPADRMPIAAEGTTVTAFARQLDHPRWLYVLPDGDVLVAETSVPPRPKYGKGMKGWFVQHFMKQTRASAPSANRITLLRDGDGDGVAETRSVILDASNGLRSPFGMALVDSVLYVANTDAVLRFPYARGQTRITAPARTIMELPAGAYNQHWTRNLLASRDGSRLYVSVGSASNVAEHGMAEEAGRAAIWELNLRTGAHRVFASGLRNPVGMAWEPERGALWVAVNERDELGSDLVPDYMTAVREGGFYGWPYSYFGQHVDGRVEPRRPDLVATAIVPDYALGPHTASLGLAASRGGAALPDRFARGMFVAQHGSWNRKPASGFKVIFVPFSGGVPHGEPVDVLTGFRDENENAMGRPVGVVIDAKGALLVSDDIGGAVWRVSGAPASTP